MKALFFRIRELWTQKSADLFRAPLRSEAVWQRRTHASCRGLLTRLLPILCGAAVFLTVLTGMSFMEGNAIYSDTLRLHIRAASDSAGDQALKLLVRDRLVTETARLTVDAQDAREAEQRLTENLLVLCTAAEETLRENGSDAFVTVSLDAEYFNTRQYEMEAGTLTLPAGRYRALVVTIGEGKGHNWWCVLYPSLCLPAAEAQETDALLRYSEEERELVLGECRVRFWLLDAAARVASFLRGEVTHTR